MMKRIVFLCVAVFLLCQTAVFAHTMTEDEMFVGGVGRGCTLGYVESVYGVPADKKEMRGDGIRAVTYIYSPTFSITARTGQNDMRPESELIVVGFSCKDASLRTPSALAVGMPYAAVTERFGAADTVLTDDDGRRMYVYDVYHGAREVLFYVNDNDVITEIAATTEV